MSIVTKTGDTGTTGLADGRRISKADYRISTYGTLDELVSFMGLARSFLSNSKISQAIKEIQCHLFMLGTELAGGTFFGMPEGCKDRARREKGISEEHLKFLDTLVSEYENLGKMPHGFIVPGESKESSFLDVARTVCRRLERKMVGLKEKNEFNNEIAIKYVNRLSDLLYIFARNV